MKNSRFNKIIKDLTELDTRQYRKVKEEIVKIDDKKFVANSLETNYHKINCPHCESKEFYRWGKQHDLCRYKCKECKRTFNTLTGTYLARLRRKGHWFDYANCIKQGYSIRKSAEICGISKTTSFRWRHRFIEGVNSIKAKELNGIVEVDNTFWKISYKGDKYKRDIYINNKVIPKNLKEINVLFSRDRNKNTFDVSFHDFKLDSLYSFYKPVLGQDILLCSNNYKTFLKFFKENNFKYGTLNYKNNETLKKDIIHIKNVNLYYDSLKKWMKRFKGVATKYLNNYLSWYRQLDEFDMNIPVIIVLRRAKMPKN